MYIFRHVYLFLILPHQTSSVFSLSTQSDQKEKREINPNYTGALLWGKIATRHHQFIIFFHQPRTPSVGGVCKNIYKASI
ncbi:unnamed protein product [Cuscuta campestris]|uniref:Secreted protein n=1 Tax=Cuscuta campestris TaxID=132261 RepID=A0A484L312_9ASTE|nr:unnamed protein product [Cuscuta campestris]